jgi:benzoyl-CoA 2,3-dioxygenase component B
MLDLINVSYDTQIPNNVGLSQDRKVLKALENVCRYSLGWGVDE